MAKIDKSLYTKEQFRRLKEQRRLEKESKVEIIEKDTNIAFVIGNGVSRKSINLNNLKSFGKTYGCNALYRDFDPDVLIAVDTKMVLELNQNRYQLRVPVWTNPNKAYASMSGFNFFDPSKGWSSGPTALWKASEDGFETIYILGFDYQGIGEQHNRVNNVYAGSFNYKKEHEAATYYGNWLKQTVTTIQKNPKKRYIRVLGEDKFIPMELSRLDNLIHISVEDFENLFNKN